MSALNDSLSRDLACLFLPTTSTTNRSATLQPWDARALARACCLFAHAKFLDLRSSWSLSHAAAASFSSSSFRSAAARGRRTGGGGGGVGDRSWLGLGEAVAATLPSLDAAAEGRPVVTLAAQATLRGVMVPEAKSTPGGGGGGADPAVAALLNEQLPRSLRLAPWRPPRHRAVEAVYSAASAAAPVASSSPEQPAALTPTTRGLALCANRSDAGSVVARVLGRAAEMAAGRAYLHWYERHGVGADDFAAAFDGLRRVVEEYGELGGGRGEGLGWEEEQSRLRGRAALRVVRDYAVN